ncbi:N-6 DNA methylase [Pseudomonas brassicacearum]|uniref:N-6 DNA methylase n=1 Tax=Pseudomonas brassicacearum TaxID=930166 RepID=UPI0006403C78|nr:N-6 DNA methylase [Pseudomonas brassicacearum]
MTRSRVANAKTEASNPAAHRKNLIRLLNANSHRHHLWDVFADFCEIGALAMSNSVDLAHRNERENRYLSLIKKYEPNELHRFPQMLAELTMAMEYGPDDVLGRVFGELELGNSSRGQFFTPYPVCQIMATQLIGDGKDLHERLQERGFITVAEPACGAGAMPIAFADALTNKGVNFQSALHVIAQDLDSRAVHMTYLQLSILHIPAIIILGNTLLMEERELWYTPAHILGGWNYKLRNTQQLTNEQAYSVSISDECIKPLPTAKQINGHQFALF